MSATLNSASVLIFLVLEDGCGYIYYDALSDVTPTAQIMPINSIHKKFQLLQSLRINEISTSIEDTMTFESLPHQLTQDVKNSRR